MIVPRGIFVLFTLLRLKVGKDFELLASVYQVEQCT